VPEATLPPRRCEVAGERFLWVAIRLAGRIFPDLPHPMAE